MSAAVDTFAPKPQAITCRWSRFLGPQRRLFDFEPERGPGEVQVTTIEALLGGYGAGKSEGVARKFFRRCAAAAWSEGYGENQPSAVAIAPSSRILHRVTIPKLDNLIPRDLILSRRKSPYPMITLVNGCQIHFVSAEADFEGEGLHAIWCDEIQHPAYTSAKFTNYLARLRDPHQPVLSMLVSGLPVAGRVRETFDLSQLPAEERRNRITILAGTRDNPHIPQSTIDAIMATVPSGQQSNLIGGDWMMPEGAVFSMFSNDLHLVDDRGDKSRPTSLGIDIGQHGAVVFGQEIMVPERDGKQGLGALICDEILTEGLDVEAACVQAKARGWNVLPSKSEIYVDPTIRGVELATIRRHFPGVHVVVRDREDPFYYVEEGVRHFQAQLRNAWLEVHLKISRHLNAKNGLVDSIVSARRHEASGALVKDDAKDHVLDAARYLIVGMLRPKRPGPSARPRG